MTSVTKKIRFLYKNLKISHMTILSNQLGIINYSNNLILKKKHLLYNILKKFKNK